MFIEVLLLLITDIQYYTIYLLDSAAGADLSSISAHESVELTRAKQQIFNTLVEWAERSR